MVLALGHLDRKNASLNKKIMDQTQNKRCVSSLCFPCELK